MKISLSAAFVLLSGALVSSANTGQRICIGKRDIGFIVDSSGSIRSHYGIVKSFVKNVAEEIGISLSGTRAGVLLFSDNAILKVKLNQFDNTADFNNAVDNLEHLDSGTYIGLAIKTALEQLFTIPNGMRVNVPNVLILLTDGLTHDPEIVATAVRQIRKVGIKLVVIGIGESVSKTQLLKIVEESEHLYLPKTFQDLLSKMFINNIVSELCHVKGCQDKIPNCARFCKFPLYAKVNCRNTCGYCPEKNYHVPVQFVTERNIIRAANETDKFAIQLCGGCLYDGHTAYVALNLQNANWHPDSGISLDVSVYSQYGRKIGTNVQNGKLVQDFAFTYKSKYGDLVIEAKTGKYTTYTYTVTLQFSSRKTDPSVTSSCLPRWTMNSKETRRTNKIISFTNSQGYRRGHILKRVFKNDVSGMVITEKEKRFQLNYCFPEKRTYDLTVSTVALDTKSGFATYVCSQRSKHCSVRNSQFYDASGAAVNFVPIRLRTLEDLGPIKVIVKGDGRHSKKNKFTLAASNCKNRQMR